MPLRYSGVRAGAALVVRCYIVSVLTQVVCSPKLRKMASGPTWRGTILPKISLILLVSVFCLLLRARPRLRWILLRLSRWLCLFLLVMLTCTSTCEVLIGFMDRSLLPQST